MPDREVRVREALKDIHAGMDDAVLMEKYKLSPSGLKSLFEELTALGLLGTRGVEDAGIPKVRIKIREFLKDFRSGLNDAALMKKYTLSRSALDMLYKRLLDFKAIRPDELFGEPSTPATEVASSDSRERKRYCLELPLIVYEYHSPAVKGTVRDITEKGVGVEGLRAHPGEVMTLVLDAEEFFGIEPFQFRAECRWNRKDQATQSHSAGFRIMAIGDRDLATLRMLIPLLTLCV